MDKEIKDIPVPRWRRQDYFAKKWFQFRILLYYILILLGGAGALGFYLYRHSYRKLRFEMFQSHSFAASVWDILRDDVIAANAVATLAIIIVAGITTFVMLHLVSRAAGRLTDNLKMSVKGELVRDWAPPHGIYEFQHLQRLFGDALENHRIHVREVRMLSGLLEEQVRQVRQGVEGEGKVIDPKLLKDIHVQCEKLRNAYERFGLPGN